MQKNYLCSCFAEALSEGLLFVSWHWRVPLLFSEPQCILGTVVQSSAVCVVLLHLSHCAASSSASKRLWCFRPPLSWMQIGTLAWAKRLQRLTACQIPRRDVSSVQLREKSLEPRFICQANSDCIYDLKWVPTNISKMLTQLFKLQFGYAFRSQHLVFPNNRCIELLGFLCFQTLYDSSISKA